MIIVIIKYMARRKLENRDVRKLNQSGKSGISVNLPISYVRDLKWKRGQKVVVKRIKGGLQIKDWRSPS
ncbi:MAG: hypothetical protein COU09_02745 [Candidatus Harrisonbacteria bacterium CG10_big_fil_rev_8_21_14_0_10_44_23]|uniref:SpoVT-AbrB domain-containing protein n=1 Tax=Candidatus Harrisonbacteria bacterium CG10_big_fil_rev_8_21_14_0_10_44_23 TaxID=1974585 RepID=A0A2H0UPJ2_9BACT|nr:MAG: hypothetical protein COU09_02745 [Candidatus Harrisonbacteria bacterium CG10_big_fil_rev_8_21_14_0_10_44_23]